MKRYELTFRRQHDCTYNDFSRQYPTAVVSHRWNYSKGVIESVYNDLQDRKIRPAIGKLLNKVGSRIL